MILLGTGNFQEKDPNKLGARRTNVDEIHDSMYERFDYGFMNQRKFVIKVKQEDDYNQKSTPTLTLKSNRSLIPNEKEYQILSPIPTHHRRSYSNFEENTELIRNRNRVLSDNEIPKQNSDQKTSSIG